MNFSWEGLLRVCEVVSIIAGAVTVIALIGQVTASRVLSGRQNVEMENLRLVIATQQERAANAEKALLVLQERQRQRIIDPTAVLAALKGKAVGTVMILCDPNVPDSYDPLGMQLQGALATSGWKVSMRYAVANPTPKLDEGLTKPIPTVYREGVTIEGVLEDCEEKNTPYCSLYIAFKAGGLDFQATRVDAFEKDTFRILIGPRRLLEHPPQGK
jgi:hypothetical protein